MKKVLLLIVFVIQSSLFANKIDELKSDIEVQKFIRKQNRELKDFDIVSLNDLYPGKNERRIADSLSIKTWQKADFDNNGQTDLLVSGIWRGYNSLIAIVADGNKYNLYPLNKGFIRQNYFPRIELINNTTTLLLSESCEYCDDRNVLKTNPLIFKFGQFIEPNFKPKQYKIEKIEYSTSMCFGTCPVFKIEINANRYAFYKAEQYNDLQGDFYSTISTEKYNDIINLLNYIDFPSLKDSYAVNWTDDQACTLIITYDNGKKKIINDYGKIGTNGLIQIYNKMFALRGNQDWDGR